MAYIQGNSHANGGTASFTCAVTLVAPVGSGNILLVSMGSTLDPADVVSCSDDKSNVYTQVDVLINPLTTAFAFVTFFCANITNAPQTITVSIAGSGPRSFSTVVVDEYSSVATVSPLDGHTMQAQAPAGSGTDAISSGTVTTTVNGDLIYGSTVNCSGSSTMTAGTGFTQRLSIANAYMTEDLTQSSAGSVAATFTAGSPSDKFITSIMALKSASAPPVTTLMGAICL